MSIETTRKIYRGDAIASLRSRRIEVFDSDSNERLEYELYKARASDSINYWVVDYTKENDPDEFKYPYWAYE